jgi:hypothetical protein
MSEVIVFAGCAFRATPAGLVDTRKEIRGVTAVRGRGGRRYATR